MSRVSSYDISQEAQEVLEARNARRTALREQFLKLKTDPFKHASQQGGAVFDPALLRYHAMQVNNFDYFKPSGRNTLKGIFYMVAPIVGYFYFLYTSKHKQEASFRRGEVAYKDRKFKFV